MGMIVILMMGVGIVCSMIGFAIGNVLFISLLRPMFKKYLSSEHQKYFWVGIILSALASVAILKPGYMLLFDDLLTAVSRQNGSVPFPLFSYGFYGFLWTVLFYLGLIFYMGISSYVGKKEKPEN